MEISEKEFAVIREISNNHLPDQRLIATRAGISLGLTNLIIKRLIKKGYIKAKQLDRKKIQYLLTPKGFSEKAKKSYNFTLRTIGFFTTIREKLQELITSGCQKGAIEFAISGNDELADIVEFALKNMPDKTVKFSRNSKESTSDGKTLLTVYTAEKNYSVDIMDTLVESGLFYQ
jgi:DNA-binding MarR family transcriptional regulator